MNAYEKAVQILDQIVDAALALEPDYQLPPLQYARIGDAVVTCASVQVAAVIMSPEGAQTGVTDIACDAIQIAPFACIIARDCASTMNDDGSDNVAKLSAASEQGAKDAQFLWNFAQKYDPFFSKTFDVGWTFVGGILLTTLTLTTGID